VEPAGSTSRMTCGFQDSRSSPIKVQNLAKKEAKSSERGRKNQADNSPKWTSPRPEANEIATQSREDNGPN